MKKNHIRKKDIALVVGYLLVSLCYFIIDRSFFGGVAWLIVAAINLGAAIYTKRSKDAEEC